MSETKHTPGPWEAKEWRVCAIDPVKLICQTAYNNKNRTAEAQANASLIAAAPDHALFVRSLLIGTARWEPFGGRSGREGEVCVGGLRYCTKTDEFGVPILNDLIRNALMKNLGEGGHSE